MYVCTSSINTLAGLNAGILCSGIMIVVPCEMLRAVFCERVFTMKLPKPRRYTFLSLLKESFTISINHPNVSRTCDLSNPVDLAISFTMSALVMMLLSLLIFVIIIQFLRHFFERISLSEILPKKFKCKYRNFFLIISHITTFFAVFFMLFILSMHITVLPIINICRFHSLLYRGLLLSPIFLSRDYVVFL